MAGEEVILLDLWSSPFAMRVRIALAEKGVEYEEREEILNNKSQVLLKMNPVYKQVPVLIHNGRPICESLIIVEYIDEVWSHKTPLCRLLPTHPYERANARFWANYIDNKIYNIGKLIWGSEGEVQEAAKKELVECFKLLEKELGDKCFFGGLNLNIVDVALIPFYSWFYAMETCGNFSIVDECPHLVAWAKRCMLKESVSKSLPDQFRVYSHLLELRKLHLSQLKA
ncbi:probable glutathione S-transferase parC [Amaranthus tricolor]|uniref:probable glutathione S-transferase parC n=1 Tax=Amaranthus tricolor TaxID=29722 RepID=UPI00258BE081|nr:probable glutathione S-transferase parC [Amaranthus tricolor]